MLALALTGAFVGANLYYNHGHLGAPIDDAYIHMQYAKQIAGGHFLQYNAGDPISSASSFLYPILLAIAYFVGAHGTHLLAAAILFGGICLAFAAAFTCALASRLVDMRMGLLAGALVATNGALLWAATSGMEVTLLAALVMASLYFYVRERDGDRFLITPALLALAALTRPEGLIFSLFLTAAVLDRLRRHGHLVSARAAYALLPVLAGAGLVAFNDLTMGTLGAPGVQVKSLLADPIVYVPLVLHRILNNLTAMLGQLSGLSTMRYVLPGAAFFVVLGAVYLSLYRRSNRVFLWLTCAGALLAFVAISSLDSALWHHLRYALPLLPLLLLFVAVGIRSPLLVAPSASYARVAVYAFGTLAIGWSLALIPSWGLTAGEESASIREQQVSLAHWIHTELPAGAKVGVNDVGAITYYGSHRTVDLTGLTDPALAEPSRNGGGSLFEAMQKLPPSKLPNYFAVYPDTFLQALPEFVNAGVIAQPPIKAFDLTTELPTLVAGRHAAIFTADWSTIGTGARPPIVLEQALRYTVNVADLDSERDSDYKAQISQVGLQPMSILRTQAVPDKGRVTDGGRNIVGGESFTAHNIVAGRPVTLIGRLSGEPGNLRVFADGRKVGQWNLGPSLEWREQSFTIPAQFVGGGDLKLTLEPTSPQYAPFSRYSSFHYWLFQPD